MSRDVFAGRPRLRLLLFRSKAAIARTFPLWLGRSLGYAVGILLWLADVRGRKVVRRNLAHFIPRRCPEALDRAVRRNYVNFSWYVYESLRQHRLPAPFFQAPQLTVVDPWGVFAGKPLGSPAILVTVHSNWELLAAVMHSRNLIAQVEVIALSSGDPRIDALYERMRNAVGARSLSLDHAPLGALRALRAGKILGLVGDRDYTGNGMLVPFAGEPMSLPLGPAALAVQTQAPIIPIFLARHGHTRFMLVIGKPLRADATQPKAKQVAELTHRLAEGMVRFIASAPAQWVSFHDAWTRAR